MTAASRWTTAESLEKERGGWSRYLRTPIDDLAGRRESDGIEGGAIRLIEDSVGALLPRGGLAITDHIQIQLHATAIKRSRRTPVAHGSSVHRHRSQRPQHRSVNLHHVGLIALRSDVRHTSVYTSAQRGAWNGLWRLWLTSNDAPKSDNGSSVCARCLSVSVAHLDQTTTHNSCRSQIKHVNTCYTADKNYLFIRCPHLSFRGGETRVGRVTRVWSREGHHGRG